MSESKISIALVKRDEQKSRILRPVKVAIIMYKILASVLAILLSTQMIVPLAFAAEQSEGKAGKGSRDVGASELSEEAALGAASLTIPRVSSTASGTTVSAVSAEKGATSSAAAKPGAVDSTALPMASPANSNAAKSAHFSLNQNTIGNYGLSTSVTITLDCSGKEGDSFVLKISK